LRKGFKENKAKKRNGGNSSIRKEVEKAKLSLCSINYAPCHEDIWGIGGIGPPLLTSALSEW
jgi:hypothetical protein